MKKLSRNWSRVCILFIGLFMILMTVATQVENDFIIIAATLCILASIGIKFYILRCPHCGWGGSMPQWSKSENSYCPKCKKTLEYD